MSERSVTLLEIHLGEVRVQIGSKTFGFGSKESSAAADEAIHESTETAASRSRGRRLAKAGAVVLGLLLLVAAGAVAWTQLRNTDLAAAEEVDKLP